MVCGARLLLLFVGVFEEVASVQRDHQPRRFDGVDDPQHAVRGASEAPVILQPQHHAATVFAS